MYTCPICEKQTAELSRKNQGQSVGNTKKFSKEVFHLWRCEYCHSIITEGEVSFSQIYQDYVLENRTLDFFAKITYRNLLKRISPYIKNKKINILDYGCGKGIFIEFLKKEGFENIVGYDPYVKEFSDTLKEGMSFDLIVANDVIEHTDDPRQLFSDLVRYLGKDGTLYVGTCDSEGVEDLQTLRQEAMRLHLPYHRVLFSQAQLKKLV
jgi:2-polyprenyl-3-methyl-5-hydroxy-6-metoxy-1,4-benzoquinol methylase